MPVVDDVHAAIRRAPLLARPVLATLAVIFLPWLLAPICVYRGVRTTMAALYTAAFAAWAFAVANSSETWINGGYVPPAWWLLMLATPFAIAAVALARPLGRWFAPCRTVAWTALWSLPIGTLVLHLLHGGKSSSTQAVVGAAIIWVVSAVVLGWRAAKGSQESRMFGPDGPLAAHAAPGPGAAPADTPAGPAGNGRAGAPARRRAARAGTRRPSTAPARRASPRSTRTTRPATRSPRRPPSPSRRSRRKKPWPSWTPWSASGRSRSRCTRSRCPSRRPAAGRWPASAPTSRCGTSCSSGRPAPARRRWPGSSARSSIPSGCSIRPRWSRPSASDLVGEYLGATAIKTNELIDSALGRVLFIDEAYSLVNEGDGQSDRFGAEAVQTLLKRAEDDRENLIIILAGYEKQTEAFLATNPGMASRFATRIRFPTYSTEELLSLAEMQLRAKREGLDPGARPVLWRMLDEVGRRRITDELGNGRFVRTLLEKAGQARDVRVMGGGGDPRAEDLITIGGGDLERAFSELTSRLRGYEDTPTLESAIAELDELIGLEPVKQQVRAIAAQLRVAKLRDRQGLTSQPPARHFVFTGPPGTGKTTVARILGRIFAALGLLVRPEVIEAHRADLVGEHLGSTAIKTNRLVDSALGGVLFVDEAYSLHNEGYSGGDAFGAEAVQTLLKRAEDDRDRLVIVLAGYPADMDRFLRSNPGLASRFGARVTFPSYTAHDLAEIAVMHAERAGDLFEPDAERVLEQIFAHAERAGRVDELGNGRFARSLFERACACRDVRVVRIGESATAADLTTLTADDVRGAYADLTV